MKSSQKILQNIRTKEFSQISILPGQLLLLLDFTFGQQPGLWAAEYRHRGF